MICPLFPFYGSKWRAARRYPRPLGSRVVEPFAGSAGYSLWWEPEIVVLVDADPIICGVWDYLIRARSAEILALPDLEVGQSVDDFSHLPQEARWLIGFWLNRGSAQPKKTRTAFSARTERAQLVWSERARIRIAASMHKVSWWTIVHGSYDSIPVIDGTYFVDPPYVDKGRYYRYKDVDYDELGCWCAKIPDVVVCEQEGADWLPFAPLATIKSTRGTSSEVIYTSRSIETQHPAVERSAWVPGPPRGSI